MIVASMTIDETLAATDEEQRAEIRVYAIDLLRGEQAEYERAAGALTQNHNDLAWARLSRNNAAEIGRLIAVLEKDAGQ